MHRGKYFSTSVYYDRLFATNAVKLLPGQYHVTQNNTVITTVLGSCVSVCIYDPLNGVGGMNHYMLPGKSDESGKSSHGSARYGLYAMDLLLEHILKVGGERSRLIAKVFGAGKVMDGMSDVGSQNADFAIKYLKEHKIHVAALDIGDNLPRKIYFSPASGQVFVKRIQSQTLSPVLFKTLFSQDSSKILLPAE
ncbi:MAG: chemoreceptor glutamine deamidase CheD [Desulfuromonadaceae bacterium]|nr:chemoreceptor glutamine deamidase CheD [Desulfuromonadaceae bacterium]MDD2855613.1 chemoreceptor glutamine deamidase CheD [Desulfuromonadaceae bacterium]